MRIHADTLTEQNIRDAAQAAGVGFERLNRHGSRKRHHAFDVILTGHGKTGGQWGNSGTSGAGPYKAATWDEWGIFLNRVFLDDESVTIPRVYDNRDAFRWATDGRFDHLTPAGQHLRHKWDYVCPGEFECGCGAVQRNTAAIPVPDALPALPIGATGWGGIVPVAPTTSYGDSGTLLGKALPGLRTRVQCPHCDDLTGSLELVIVHLNDSARWTREQCADWLDTLDVDLTFPTPDEIPAHIH